MRFRAILHGAFERESRAITIAFLLLLAALLMPKFKLPRDTYDYMVVFDITQSMNVEDYEQNGVALSRLDFARAALRAALRELPCGSRVGLGAFAEYRALALVEPIEVCANYNDLLASIGNVDGRMRWGNASEIAKGVFWSLRVAKEMGKNVNVIFITDGQEAPPLGPFEQPMFEDIKPGEVHGWIVGAGGYVPKPIPKTDKQGNRIGYWRAEQVVQRDSGGVGTKAGAPSREELSSLREPHLQALARQIGFDYARLAEPSTLSLALRDARYAQRRQIPTDMFWGPALLALCLLVGRFGPDLRHLTLRRRAPSL